ncbi:hypothetical protein CPK_ORF00119 [Chlamydia pneumoniae LPCoLN]|nr:hypothetical protein CPK_ORF00119 [Chlamydia pneumoniae LPCoLN]ETR80630.1 hypothetical protein X556_0037 [Chlamydia pneumoniae B21]
MNSALNCISAKVLSFKDRILGTPRGAQNASYPNLFFLIKEEQNTGTAKHRPAFFIDFS